MNLVELDRSNALYDKVGAAREVSGGSCGNTMAGLAELGGKGAYIGKVRDDQFGQIFRHDIRSIGVDFDTHAVSPKAKPPANAWFWSARMRNAPCAPIWAPPTA